MRVSISDQFHGHFVTMAPVLALTAGACGCVLGDHELDPGLSADEYELMMPNGLLSNGLPTNGLPTSGLPPSGLPTSALPTNGLASEQINQEWEDWLGAPERGATNDLLMTYIVRCALGPGESSSYTDSLGNTWTWHGELGVAPAWATGAITASQARWVTSCVLSLVNGSGLTVQISVRGPSSSAYTVTTTELLGYPNLEGAFFGDMFASTPVYYSCHGDFSDAASGRICTRNGGDGSPSCAPIQPRGSCASVCSTESRSWLGNSYDVFRDCTGADALTYSEVTTTMLAPL